MSSERNTHQRTGTRFSFELAAGAMVYKGRMVALAAGFADAATAAVNLTCVGVAVESAFQTDGDTTVTAELGAFKFFNSTGADEITRVDIGADCYMADDETLAKTDGGGTRSVAGTVRQIETDGVWVQFN